MVWNQKGFVFHDSGSIYQIFKQPSSSLSRLLSNHVIRPERLRHKASEDSISLTQTWFSLAVSIVAHLTIDIAWENQVYFHITYSVRRYVFLLWEAAVQLLGKQNHILIPSVSPNRIFFLEVLFLGPAYCLWRLGGAHSKSLFSGCKTSLDCPAPDISFPFRLSSTSPMSLYLSPCPSILTIAWWTCISLSECVSEIIVSLRPLPVG